MKRIALHVLVALALILQGSVATFGAVRVHAAQKPCCPHEAAASSPGMAAHQPDCPCPSKQPCSTACHVMCAAGTVAVAMPVFTIAWMRADGSPAALDARLLRPLSDSPPIRPPIA